MATAAQAADLNNSFLQLSNCSVGGDQYSTTFLSNGIFKVRKNTELVREAIVLKVSFESGIQIAQTQYSVALIDFSLEGRQQADLPYAELR